MSADTVGALIEDLLRQRRQRSDRVTALVQEIRGLPEPPILLESPPVPAAEPAGPYREALAALRIEHDGFKKRGLELHDEVNRLREVSANEEESRKAMAAEISRAHTRIRELEEGRRKLHLELDELRSTARSPAPVRADLDAYFREIVRILAERREQ